MPSLPNASAISFVSLLVVVLVKASFSQAGKSKNNSPAIIRDYHSASSLVIRFINNKGTPEPVSINMPAHREEVSALKSKQ